jgi:hypothetical protein
VKRKLFILKILPQKREARENGQKMEDIIKPRPNDLTSLKFM